MIDWEKLLVSFLCAGMEFQRRRRFRSNEDETDQMAYRCWAFNPEPVQ